MKNQKRRSKRGRKQQIAAAVIVGVLVLAMILSVLPAMFAIG